MSTIITNTVVADRKRGILRFRVAAGNGQRVLFPVKFKNDLVDVHIANHYDGVCTVVCGVTADDVTDRNGFTLSKQALPGNGDSAYWDTRINPVTVVVFGDLVDEDEEQDESGAVIAEI